MGNVLEINIDTDKPCRICGKDGTTDSGVCLECITKRGSLSWRIKDKTIEACIDLIQSDLWRYQSDMNRAYTLNPGNLDITLKLKISPEENGQNKIESGISFVIEKLNEKGEPVYVSEDQLNLPLK